MKLKKILFVILSLSLLAYVFIPSRLRSDDLGKANKYYDKYDYYYAIEIYERLMKKGGNLEVAEKLANSYRFTGNTIEAEKNYAKVLSYPNFNTINYLYYAEVLKQNAKYEEAKHYYLMYGEREPSQADKALRLANSCDMARMWAHNPNLNIIITNEGSLNSEQSDFSPVIYQDGLIFASDRFFTQTTANPKNNKVYGWTGNGYIKIYQAEQDPKAPKDVFKLSAFPNYINKEFHNGPASISYDGKTLAFTKSGIKKTAGKKKKETTSHNTIYFSTFENNSWTEPQPFEHNNIREYSVHHPALNKEGNVMYFVSDMPGGYGGMDLYYSEKKNGKWTSPVNCGSQVNTPEDEVFPYLRGDGKLYFSSRGHLTMGGLDIFEVEGEKSAWSEPRNLKTPINSSKDDFGITFFDDNQSGYFSSNRKGGKGLDDIYHFVQKPVEKVVLQIAGQVFDKVKQTAISGLKVFLYNKNTGKEETAVSDENGAFVFYLDQESDYTLRGDLDKFFSRQEGEISTKGVKESTIYNVKFEVERAEEAYLVRLNNIYYDFDKYAIRKDAEPELLRVVEFMNKVGDVNVQMQAHTDSRGKADYNMQLSVKRANAARDYLMQQGVDKERLSARGFGKTQLLNSCADGVKCTEEEHQLNRRTEFKVIRINPVTANLPSPLIKY